MKIDNKKICLILLIFLIGGYGISCKDKSDSDLDKRIEETKHLQSHRKEIIDGMLDGGLASRIENPDGKPYIYVTEPFYMLTQSDRAALMNAIWYYYITEDRNVEVLTIYDNNTGNEVGTFGKKGLLMDE